VLVIACSPGMTGAGWLAARAAQRAGAGLVTLAAPESLNPVLETMTGSVMTMPLPETEGGALGMEAAHAIADVADRFSAFALGPGLRTAEETRRMVRVLAWELLGPVVIDADGLNALAGQAAGALASRAAPAVLTPHPGEMARLLPMPGAAEVQADRAGAARRLAMQTGTVVVLKGQGTIITDGQRLVVNTTGNPGMACGGMGDVLTGLIAGLICQGLTPFDAAHLAVFAHGLAGDLGARDLGELSLIPEDVLERLPRVFRQIERAGGEGANQGLEAEPIVRAVMEGA
jgi:NAD(P)H-hydrate epimerase